MAFVLVKAPSKIISTHKIDDRVGHQELLEKARERGLYLYYAETHCVEGKIFAKQPWLIDWESVANNTKQQTEPVSTPVINKEPGPDPIESQKNEIDLSCPFCGKPCTSTPGRTLHIKSKHPEQFEKYKKSIK